MSQSKVNEKQMRLSRPQLPCDPIIAEAWRKDALQLVEAGTSLEDIDLIAAIFYASPHLHQIAKKITANHPRDMARTLSGETNQIIEEAFSSFRQELDTLQNAEQAMALLRYFRHRTYFTLALAELAGMIDVSEQSVTKGLRTTSRAICLRQSSVFLLVTFVNTLFLMMCLSAKLISVSV